MQLSARRKKVCHFVSTDTAVDAQGAVTPTQFGPWFGAEAAGQNEKHKDLSPRHFVNGEIRDFLLLPGAIDAAIAERASQMQPQSDEKEEVEIKENEAFEIEATIEHVQIEAWWKEKTTAAVDVDVHASVYGSNKQFKNNCNYGNKTYPSSSNSAIVFHTDVRRGLFVSSSSFIA